MTRRIYAWIGMVALAAVCAACAQSDAGITTKVKAKLESDRTVTNPATIEVVTTGKVVTLTGTAASDAEKVHVVEVVKSTDGVKDVVDNLTILVAPAPAPADATAPGGTAAAPGAPAPAAPEAQPPAASPTTAPAR